MEVTTGMDADLALHFLVEFAQLRRDPLGLKRIVRITVRRADHVGYALLHRHIQHPEAVFYLFGPIVHAVEDVGVNIDHPRRLDEHLVVLGYLSHARPPTAEEYAHGGLYPRGDSLDFPDRCQDTVLNRCDRFVYARHRVV